MMTGQAQERREKTTALDPPWGHGPSDKSFEDAFSDRTGSCRGQCECGREFWDSYNSGYDWEDGEVEALEKNPAVTGLDYAVGFVAFEGRRFVYDCSCWQARARRIIAFLGGHDHAIADFLTLEKKRRQRAADHSPTVDAETP